MIEVTAARRSILLLSDGNPGHYNQSVAITEKLETQFAAQTEWLDIRQSIPGMLRRPFAIFLDRFPNLDLADLLKHHFGVHSLPTSPPCVIVSSGGKTAFFNVLIARHYGCPNIFLGDHPPLAARNFSLVVTTQSAANCDSCLQWDYLATRITPEKTAKQGFNYRVANGLSNERLWTILIGGQSRSHRYHTADWQHLAKAMNHLSERLNIRWLIATSRRTGIPAERTLKATLSPNTVADAAWWGDTQRKVIPAYLGAAEMVVCTQDSLSMITESIASAKPTYVVRPKNVLIDPVADVAYSEYLVRNVRLGRIHRVIIEDLGTIEPEQDINLRFRPITRPLNEDLIAQILPRLNTPMSVKTQATDCNR